MGEKIGKEVDLGPIGLAGYKGKIMGGSDKQGFPMKPSLPGSQRKKALMKGGVGYRRVAKGVLVRKTVAASEIGPNTEQLNVKITHYGNLDLASFMKVKETKPEDQMTAKERAVKASLEMAGSTEIGDPKSIKGKVRG